jgi:hypothetical protein
MAISTARASSTKSNGHARQAPPPADKGEVVSEPKAPGKLDDMWAATKAGLQSEEAKLMYLQFGGGIAVGAGVMLGATLVHKALS